MADLVTLSEYKAYAGITSPNHDAEISALIPKVSALVKSICRRSFVDYVDDPKVEIFNGGVGPRYWPYEYPIINVISLEYSIDYGNTYTELVELTDWVIDREDDSIFCINSTDGSFPKYVNGYKLTYTAGFETIPEDLKLAILDLITYYMKNDMAVHSNKAPGTNTVQVEYVTTTNLPAHIKRVLDLYVGRFD